MSTPTLANRSPLPQRPGLWPLVRRALTVAFFLAVVTLLANQARSIEWPAVWGSVQALPVGAVAAGVALAVCSHTLYSTFDLFGRHLTGHPLRRGQVMLVTFISYAFNLNLGALVGGFAFRYRLYHRLGLDNTTVTQVLTTSMLTNWLGYLVLAGALFVSGSVDLPPDWRLRDGGVALLGGGLLALAAAYLLACALATRRTWTVRGHAVHLPSWRMALLQAVVSSLNWLLIAGIAYVLLQERAAYATVLGVLLIAAVAGVLTHVPAGLGVLEAVFVALLSHDIPTQDVLGALLAYRAIYYLCPLVLAAFAYVTVEARAKALRPAR